MNQNHAEYFRFCILLIFLMPGAVFGQSISTCEIKSVNDLRFDNETGILWYEDRTTQEEFKTNHIHNVSLPFVPQTQNVSPDGKHVTGEVLMNSESNTHAIITMNQMQEQVYIGAQTQRNILKVQWLGNDRILSFITIGDFFGYFKIEPFNQEYTYIEPKPGEDTPFYSSVGGLKSFISGSLGQYNFTYDGQYLFSEFGVIYDFVNDQEPELKNYRWGVPSQSSHRVFSVDYETYRNEGFYPVYIYDFDTDNIIQPISFQPTSTISGKYSWSSDESLLAYTLYYSNEDLESFRRLELLDLTSGDIRSTCFGLKPRISGESELSFIRGFLSPDFSWSRDSRYLALKAVIEGQDMDESFGLYLYDTQTADIYLVHQGNADIIGWMAHSEDTITD